MALERVRLTVDDFDAFLARPENQDRLFELIHGEIVAKTGVRLHSIVVGLIVKLIGVYLDDHPIGYVGPQASFRPEGDNFNDRMPDISFVLDQQRPIETHGSARYMPDLAVEVKSPGNTYKSLRERADDYLANGTRLVWLVYPERRQIEAVTADDVRFYTENDILDGGDVLPGFSVPVARCFPRQPKA